LAARGFTVVALDRSAAALTYLRRRLERRRLAADLICSDMAEFRLPHTVDAALCTFDTFRHLLSENAALRHLQCAADALKPGGIYVLGFHLLPLDVSEESSERWAARHGRTRLTATLKVVAASRRRRRETLQIDITVRNPRSVRRLRSLFDLRMYTAAQVRRLLAKIPAFELCDVYDFWYEIDRPLRLDDNRTDTVFILRKRAGSASNFKTSRTYQ
jgi:SAM-dependent methyltransferase